MIYKVYYQEDKIRNPKREQTHSLYLEADNKVEALALIEKNTPYNVEFIQELEGNSLTYEQEHADFKLTEFE